jgi:hypothetical protein
VAVQVHVSRAKYERSSELERIAAQPALPVTLAAGSSPGFGIKAAEDVQKIGGAKTRGAVCLPLLIDQQREPDAGLLAKLAGVVAVPEPYCRDARTCCPERLLALAQLRDVLAAENSSVVPEKCDHSRPGFPEGTKPDIVPVNIGKRNIRESGSNRGCHVWPCRIRRKPEMTNDKWKMIYDKSNTWRN